MKKHIMRFLSALVLLMVVCACLCGCGKDDETASGKETVAPTQAVTKSQSTADESNKDKGSDAGGTNENSKTPQDIGNAFMKAMYKDFDAQSLVSLIHEEDVKFMCNYTANTEQGAMTRDEFVDFVQGLIDEIKKGIDSEYGEWTISYVNTDSRVSKDFEDTERELIDAHYKEAGIDVEESMAVLMQGGIEYEENGTPSVDDSVMVSVYVIKSGGKWYLDFDETLYIG